MTTVQATRARTPAASTAGGAAARGAARFGVPATGVLAALLTATGLTGVGDAPAPFDEATSMAEHFQDVRSDVFLGSSFGLVGAAALTAFVLVIVGRLRETGELRAASSATAGLVIVAGYFLVSHVIYATLAYNVAATSAEVTKGMFVATILAVPVFGLGTAALLGGVAVGAWRSRIMPTWWRLVTAAGAAVSLIAVFSYADEDFFSPDVQQQVVGNIVLAWLLITGILLAVRPRSLQPDAGVA